jgi:hypothetical protein
MVHLCATRCSCNAILRVSLVSFVAITPVLLRSLPCDNRLQK